MRAAIITRPGGPEVLEIQIVETPEPQGDYVRVRVRASGINRADLLQRAGAYPAPPGSPTQIPGLEFAGIVDAIGPQVRMWKPGQRVMGLAGGGAQAEYILSHEGLLVEIPDNLDFVQAAAVPEVFITAHDALFTQAGLQMGERLLVHAAVGAAEGQAGRAPVDRGDQVAHQLVQPRVERAGGHGLLVAEDDVDEVRRHQRHHHDQDDQYDERNCELAHVQPPGKGFDAWLGRSYRSRKFSKSRRLCRRLPAAHPFHPRLGSGGQGSKRGTAA